MQSSPRIYDLTNILRVLADCTTVAARFEKAIRSISFFSNKWQRDWKDWKVYNKREKIGLRALKLDRVLFPFEEQRKRMAVREIRRRETSDRTSSPISRLAWRRIKNHSHRQHAQSSNTGPTRSFYKITNRESKRTTFRRKIPALPSIHRAICCHGNPLWLTDDTQVPTAAHAFTVYKYPFQTVENHIHTNTHAPLYN